MESTSESVEKSTILEITTQNHCQTTENTSESSDVTTTTVPPPPPPPPQTTTTTETTTSITTTEETPLKIPTKGGPMPFVCPKCPKRNFKCQETLDIHTEQHKTGQFICQICSKVCKHQASLWAHLKVHSEERPYACTMCDFRFKFLGALKNHVKLHANLKFTCPVCGKEFKDLNNCKWHEKKHSGNYKNTYNCKICDKSFVVKCLLTYHMRTHTGERPNVCEHCGAAFADKSNLQKHYRIHTGERPFKCEQCGKAFSQKSSLTCHRRSHVTFKPHICTVCNKAFGLHEELIVHMRVHGERQMFKCNLCDQEFREHCYLKSHQRIHSHVQQKSRKEWIYNENINLDDVSLYLRDGESRVEALAKHNLKELVKKELEACVSPVKRRRKTRKSQPEKTKKDAATTDVKKNKTAIKKEPLNDLPKVKRKRRRKEPTLVTVEKKSRAKRKITKEITTYNENVESDYDGGIGDDHFGGAGGFATDDDDEYVPEVTISVNHAQTPIKTNTTDSKWDNLIIEPIKTENITKTEENLVNNEDKQNIAGNITATVNNECNEIRGGGNEDVKFENNQKKKNYDEHFVDMRPMLNVEMEEVIVKVEFDDYEGVAENKSEDYMPDDTSSYEFKNKHNRNDDIDIKLLTPCVLLEQIDPEILKKYSKSTAVNQSSRPTSKKRINQLKKQSTNRLKQDRKKPGRKGKSPKSNECTTTKSIKMEIKSEIKEELSNVQLKTDNDLVVNTELVLSTIMEKINSDNQIVDAVTSSLEPVTTTPIKKNHNKLIKKSTKTKSIPRLRKFAKSFPCKLCPKGYTTPNKLAFHSIIHLDTFICGTCHLNCLSSAELIEHMKKNKKCHPKTHKLYNCTMCERTYLTRYDLTEHLSMHYQFKRFICDICDKRVNRKCQLAKHMRLHTGVKKSFKCEICFRLYWTASELRMHSVAHSKETPFKCEICEKTFKSGGRLKNHKRTHDGDLYKCSYCGKGFNVLGNLQIHELRHTGSDNIFQCNVCPKSFLFKHKLIYHMRTHTGERPFACTNCDARFADKSNLVKHYRIHSGIKPYKCGVCNKLFNQLSSLNSHKKSHITFKPFKCLYCGKCFPIEADLIVHLRAHGEFRKFKCNFCDKEYDELCHMKSHRRLHTNESHVSDDRIVSVEYEKWDRLRKMHSSLAGENITMLSTENTAMLSTENTTMTSTESIFPTTTVTNIEMNNEVFIITDLTNSTKHSQMTENENTNLITESTY